MNFLNHIKKLEKRGIISRKPHPIIPFILAFIIFIFGIITFYINIDNLWGSAFFFLAGFTFIFAILHWIVVKIVEGKVK